MALKYIRQLSDIQLLSNLRQLNSFIDAYITVIERIRIEMFFDFTYVSFILAQLIDYMPCFKILMTDFFGGSRSCKFHFCFFKFFVFPFCQVTKLILPTTVRLTTPGKSILVVKNFPRSDKGRSLNWLRLKSINSVSQKLHQNTSRNLN